MITTPSSDATTMAWNWVIQSIARFKQVDSSTLAGLVEKAPASSVDLGKDAKEAVSLRILESLFLHGSEATVDTVSAQNDRISFDPSEHCEDILHRILDETSEPMTDLETRKWNIQPFITHKRASLPKSPLQKFKEALLEGSHPILESLKEMSKRLTRDETGKNYFVFRKTENEKSKLPKSPLQKSDHVEDSNIGITGHELTIEPAEENSLMDHADQIVPDSPEESSDHADVDHGQHQSPTDDIAAQKEAFLSSQCALSQDFNEIFVCMKCNKGGQLLVCSSDACPFRVHNSCLGSSTTFDENPDFFCPFCAYSHAISDYMEVKKKAALARKDLQAFLTSRVKHRPNIPSKTGVCLDENTSTHGGATGEKFKLNENEVNMSKDKDCAPVDLVHETMCEAGVSELPLKQKESPVSNMSSHAKRNRRQEPQYTSPTINLPRRMNLFWEKSEEEMLREGVRKFSCDDTKKIPWKKILEFGREVFEKSRTTIDLKDKWRNMCKENPATKRQRI